MIFLALCLVILLVSCSQPSGSNQASNNPRLLSSQSFSISQFYDLGDSAQTAKLIERFPQFKATIEQWVEEAKTSPQVGTQQYNVGGCTASVNIYATSSSDGYATNTVSCPAIMSYILNEITFQNVTAYDIAMGRAFDTLTQISYVRSEPEIPLYEGDLYCATANVLVRTLDGRIGGGGKEVCYP